MCFSPGYPGETPFTRDPRSLGEHRVFSHGEQYDYARSQREGGLRTAHLKVTPLQQDRLWAPSPLIPGRSVVLFARTSGRNSPLFLKLTEVPRLL